VLWRATLAWQREMRTALAPHGLTHVQFVLLASLWWLSEQGDPPTQKELADRAGTDAMMTSQVLRKLEAAGLIERNPHPRDSRARLLAVTREGREKLRAALSDVEAADARFFTDPAGVVAALGDEAARPR